MKIRTDSQGAPTPLFRLVRMLLPEGRKTDGAPSVDTQASGVWRLAGWHCHRILHTPRISLSIRLPVVPPKSTTAPLTDAQLEHCKLGCHHHRLPPVPFPSHFFSFLGEPSLLPSAALLFLPFPGCCSSVPLRACCMTRRPATGSTRTRL